MKQPSPPPRIAASYQSCCLAIRGSGVLEQCPISMTVMASCIPYSLTVPQLILIDRCNLSTFILDNLKGSSTYFGDLMGLWAERNDHTSKLLSFELYNLYKLDLQQWLSQESMALVKVNYIAHKYNQITSVHIC